MKPLPLSAQTLIRILQAGGSIEADTMFPERMKEIAAAAAANPHKPQVTFRVKGAHNPDLLAEVATIGKGCITFVFPSDLN